MKPTTILAAALASLTSASPLTFQEKCDKYKCLTLDTVENWNPICARNCFHENLGNSLDGCPPDDFRCHCKRAGEIAPVMKDCLTSNAAGCSMEDLHQIRMNFFEACGYFNQTGYEGYRDCPKLLYEFVTFAESHPNGTV